VPTLATVSPETITAAVKHLSSDAVDKSPVSVDEREDP